MIVQQFHTVLVCQTAQCQIHLGSTLYSRQLMSLSRVRLPSMDLLSIVDKNIINIICFLLCVTGNCLLA